VEGPAAAALLALLERARDQGMLGPGPVEDHLVHARSWAGLLDPLPPRILDLGSGAGVPGLVFAIDHPESTVTLLDARERRGEWLAGAAEELGLTSRVEVVVGRAEVVARTARREGFDLVVARGFGSPAVTAECATGFLHDGGRLSVSEPPDGGETRWREEILADLGLGPPRFVRGTAGFVILRKHGPTDSRWPRRDGVPQHRPLW
jgi:16S rRNA (guanine527-N7)-methyltransferase